MDVSMKIKGGLFVVALLVVPTLGTTSRAQTSNPFYQCVSRQFLVNDVCTGEVVSGEGELCMSSILVRDDQAGGLHALWRIHTQSTAVGLTTGQKYRLHGVFNLTQNLSHNGVFVGTITQSNHWNTAGGQNDRTLKQVDHITINANGELTVDKSEFEVFCQ